MTQYNMINVKLSNSRNKSAIKNGADEWTTRANENF